jgi:four helix bundle protein
MDEAEFKRRTKQLGIDVIRLCDVLPNRRASNVIAGQIIKSATSVGANYRASCRGRSLPEIIAKLSIVEEESDETAYWLEVLLETGMADKGAVAPLLDEARQIVAMTVASKRTLKARAGVQGFGDAPSSIVNRES